MSSIGSIIGRGASAPNRHAGQRQLKSMSENWLERWEKGRTGWHEEDGNAGLKAHWPSLRPVANRKSRVLVPLCGKTPDLVWLAEQGHEVVGIELSEIAIRQLFAEHNLAYRLEEGEHLDRYSADEISLTLYCGDYFDFRDKPFDALFDRGSLVALPEAMRLTYIEHTKNLLHPGATKMVITLEYDQAVTPGPPFSVLPEELTASWPDLHRVAEFDDIDNCPPKFRAAGLKTIHEVVWLST